MRRKKLLTVLVAATLALPEEAALVTQEAPAA